MVVIGWAAGVVAVLAVIAAAWAFVRMGQAQTRASVAESLAGSMREQTDHSTARAQEAAEEARRRITDIEARLEKVAAERNQLHSGLLEEQARHEASVRNATTAAAGVVKAHEEKLAGLAATHDEKLGGVMKTTKAQVEGIETRERLFREEMEAREKQMETRVREAFAALSQTALSGATTEFLKLAEVQMGKQREVAAAELDRRREAVDVLVKPIAESLKKTDEKLAELEKGRVATSAQLDEQLKQVLAIGTELRDETGKLARALREPHVRGRYGEMQLRRVAELAGMEKDCDFTEQSQTIDADGRPLRPDMVVNLPSGRCVVIDAKTNIQAFLDALQTTDTKEQEAHLDRFARHVAEQATALSKKKYWASYEGSPDFVVMFVPGDHFLDAALKRIPDLAANAARQNVIFATPTMLIGLLRVVAVGYREAQITKAAAELLELGRTLHQRAATAFEHIAKLGGHLDNANKSFNQFVGSYQSRLSPALRDLESHGAKSEKDVPHIKHVEGSPDVQRMLTGAVTTNEPRHEEA